MTTILPGDAIFENVYRLNLSTRTGVYSFSGDVGSPVNTWITDGARVVDNIFDSVGRGDSPDKLGDNGVADLFTAQGITSNLITGTFKYIKSTSFTLISPNEPPTIIVGFIAQQAAGYYFFSDGSLPFVPVSDRALTPLSNTYQAICFMAGTSIATPSRATNIEDLKIGNIVLTSDGRLSPVRWVGRQTVSALFADEIRLPVRVKAGALGENVPCRDLLVSNDHGLLVEGVLVQAGALINGVTIVRERNVPKVFTYYHVELDDHSLILAENVPAETFVDNVERYAFDNWDAYQALYPAGRSVPEMDLPRVKAQRQLPSAVRKLLLSRVKAAELEAA